MTKDPPPGNSASKWQKKDRNPALSVDSEPQTALGSASWSKVPRAQGFIGLSSVGEDPQYKEKGEEDQIRLLGEG